MFRKLLARLIIRPILLPDPTTEHGVEIGFAGPMPLHRMTAPSRLAAYTLALDTLDQLQADRGADAEVIVRIGPTQQLAKDLFIVAPILDAAGAPAKLRTRIRSARTRHFKRSLHD